MNFHNAVTSGGSGIAVIGGGYTMLVAFLEPATEASHTSIAGLVVALGGLATAIGAQVQPALKMYLDERRESRRAADARHDLSNQLNSAKLEITLLKLQHDEMVKTIDDNRTLIHLLANRDNSPTEAHPDPGQEYRDASNLSSLGSRSITPPNPPQHDIP